MRYMGRTLGRWQPSQQLTVNRTAFREGPIARREWSHDDEAGLAQARLRGPRTRGADGVRARRGARHSGKPGAVRFPP